MKDSNQYQEIQLELPHINTGFYKHMNKCSMNLPDPIKKIINDEAKYKHILSETQLSLAL